MVLLAYFANEPVPVKSLFYYDFVALRDSWFNCFR